MFRRPIMYNAPPIKTTPAITPMTIPAIAPPDKPDPDEDDGAPVAVGDWDWAVLVVVEELWLVVVVVMDADAVVEAVESTLKESIGLLAFLFQRWVA